MAPEKKKLKPNFTPVTPAAYQGIKSGRDAVSMGQGGRDVQASMPGVSQILKPVTDIVNKPLQAVGSGIKQGAASVLEKTGIAGDYRNRKKATHQMGQDRAILGLVGDSEMRGNSPITRPEPAKDIAALPSPAKDPEFTPFVGGVSRPNMAGITENNNTVSLTQPDGGSGEMTVHGGGKLSLRPKKPTMGNYEVTNSTWTPEEAERFGRQPGRPGTRMVSRGHPDFRENVSRSMGGSSAPNSLEMAKEIIGPLKIDTSGFSGDAAKARAHTQTVKYNDKLAELAGKLANTNMIQSGATDRERMGVDADIATTAMRGDIRANSLRERFGLRGKENAQQNIYDTQAAEGDALREDKRTTAKNLREDGKAVKTDKAKGILRKKYNDMGAVIGEELVDPYTGLVLDGLQQQPKAKTDWSAFI